MPRSSAFLLALLAFAGAARAQSGPGFGLESRAVAAVVQGPDTLRNAWAGGLNTPQFSPIDLNGDGQNDLFAFDRESSRCYTFLSVAALAVPAGRRWAYAPQYESLFPDDLQSWALLRDYDCDGRPDLFTFGVGGGAIRVFRNVAAAGQPRFQLATPELLFTIGANTAHILTGGYNVPAIQDVDGDGRLDVLTYDFSSASFIELYRNTSPGTCGGVASFALATGNWGGIQAGGGCAEYRFNGQPYFTARSAAQPLHTGGHGLLLLDLDGNGTLDLLDGRDNCPELVRLLNEGTALAPVLTRPGITASFPSAATPVRVPVLPTGYSFDANFDGRPDLVVAPNMLDNADDRVSLRAPVQLFTNSAPAGSAPAFAYQPAGFLQAEMLDVSEGAAPAFGDLDGDGLPDMLLGNYADRVGSAYRAALAYYRNEGTRARPVFRLVTADYLGLAARNLTGLKPALVDLNRDGALDLAYSAWNGTATRLTCLLNTASAGQPAAFNPAAAVVLQPQGLPSAAPGDVPCFVDVDNDGLVDLLLGTNDTREPGGSLRYFRNQGGPLSQAFLLVDNDFGRIRAATGARPANLSSAVADFDGDGRSDLLTADATGLLRLFANYRAQAGGLFSERTDVLYNPLSGQYETTRLGLGPGVHCALAAPDLDGDGAPELFVGTQAGGVLSYATRNRLATAAQPAAARALALAVFPNPATATATVETAAPTRVAVLDLTGRVVRAPGGAQRRHTLDVSGLAAGVYLVRAEGTDGAVAVQRLLVR